MKIKVTYRDEMVGPSAKSVRSPSSSKPGQVVEEWELLHDELIDVVSFEPVSVEALCTAHSRDYVRSVMEHEQPNGFGTIDPAVTATLPYTSGSMLAAAQLALRDGVACSPTSGFHHARYARGDGFCTFNGLIVAALAILSDLGDKARVAILDCDYHYGDGTDEILQTLKRRGGAEADAARRITHDTAGLWFQSPRTKAAAPRMERTFLDEWLPSVLASYALADVDLVLYQAGADPHIHDPYGGFMTTEGMRRRDELVFSALAGRIPVAWNLAGGYQEEDDGSIPEVLKIHENTLLEAARARK